jgi:hypothetical protein
VRATACCLLAPPAARDDLWELGEVNETLKAFCIRASTGFRAPRDAQRDSNMAQIG